MKEKFAGFIWKRISTKIDNIRNAGHDFEIDNHLDDLEEYLDALKDIFTETMKL